MLQQAGRQATVALCPREHGSGALGMLSAGSALRRSPESAEAAEA
jgi:hypothetical protein